MVSQSKWIWKIFEISHHLYFVEWWRISDHLMPVSFRLQYIIVYHVLKWTEYLSKLYLCSWVNVLVLVKSLSLIALMIYVLWVQHLIDTYWYPLILYSCHAIVIHHDDVVMGAIASQFTSLTIVYSTIYSGADQSKHQRSSHWPLCGEFTGHRWIPGTNGQ